MMTTKEEKQLVIKDLAARLPYNVIIYNTRPVDAAISFMEILTGRLLGEFMGDDTFELRPYLRPIDTMNEEEAEEIKQLKIDYTISVHGKLRTNIDGFHWFISKMFDINQLIPKGLAYPALLGMYTIQTGHK